MAIRQRAKAFFRRNRRSNGDTLSKTDSSDSYETWPSNVYKPGEAMPRPKYRQPPKKEHKDHLEAFSFAEAWRRKSFQSQYSPMGTRAPSRLPSAAPSRRSSWYSRTKSITYSRSGSVTSVDTHKSTGDGQKSKPPSRAPSQRSGKVLSRNPSQRDAPHHAAIATRLSTEVEEDGDDDVFNVGMSRVHSHDRPAASRPRSIKENPYGGTAGAPPNQELSGQRDSIQAHDHLPFTEQELALALKRSHLAPPVQAY
ncbi:hypothetical protein Q7P37_010795 [Cladosporium fusiforme]